MSVQMDLNSAAAAMGGKLLGNSGAFCGVTTDSRHVDAGQLFFALRGERFDGHAFVRAVIAQGAAASVIDQQGAEALKDAGAPLIVVEDTRLALGALAGAWRAKFSVPVIAVTGSNGKTTSKEMIACILNAAFGDHWLGTAGNFNNDIGLPLTLLGLDCTHRAAVIEMGMNHPGEIAYLASIAKPSVALVTNAQRAHLAGMGSIDSIAQEKGSLLSGLSDDGVAVFSADEPWGDLWTSQASGRKVLTFAIDNVADVNGHCQSHGLDNHVFIKTALGEFEVNLALPGTHNARNALGAVSAALAAGISLSAIQQGLREFAGVKGRLQRCQGVQGALVLNDTYNANPDSVCAGIDVLGATVGKQVLVLGDMGEIGEMTGQFHDEVGGYAKSQGIDRLFTFGESSEIASRNFGSGAKHFKKLEDLVTAVKAEMAADTTVLVKGSRFMKMERVVEAITVPPKGNP